jgi:hypothetical protein
MQKQRGNRSGRTIGYRPQHLRAKHSRNLDDVILPQGRAGYGISRLRTTSITASRVSVGRRVPRGVARSV